MALGVSTIVRRAPAVSPELVTAWRRASAEWFGAAYRPVPGAPEHRHLALVDSAVGPVVAKRGGVETPAWKRSLVRLGARPSRAVRAFELALALTGRGIATPEPLAAWSEGEAGVLVTRFVAGASPWDYLRAGFAGASIPTPHPPRGTDGSVDGLARRLEILAGAIGRSLAQLHAAGFRHRDLKAPNILLAPGPEGPRVLLLDLDGLAERPGLTEATRRRDLARLCASLESREARLAGVRAGDWEIFLRAYLRYAAPGGPSAPGGPDGPDAAARYCAATSRWAARHVERNLARGRPVT